MLSKGFKRLIAFSSSGTPFNLYSAINTEKLSPEKYKEKIMVNACSFTQKPSRSEKMIPVGKKIIRSGENLNKKILQWFFFLHKNTVSSNALSLGEIPKVKRNQTNLKKTIVHKSLIQLFWCIFHNHQRRFRPTIAFFLLVVKLRHSDRNRRLCQAIINTALTLLFQQLLRPVTFLRPILDLRSNSSILLQGHYC